ncbi:N-acetylglucosaminyl-diphospho-decaprenol L-rhamnosyltransferase [Cupriavidus pampae]|uniref:N-acetylglucosaminyl-diphospho-decaprenol L-rhamnosyltransferase n=1 Tax=Cupriavidus pampae TaxID=659251 RepID=A0ABN7YC62_9BURK|nr:N-acetylglucosaminyl-diphospho-decaprenol L-rhamnosyltransferase [Cupriavidus pampae]
MKSIDIVIVNWSSGTQLLEAMQSLQQHAGGEIASVAIVDNASIDNSLELVAERSDWNFPIHFVRNKENRGFGAACNQGARTGQAEFILFLNPDTLAYPQSLATPLAYMQRPENANVSVTGIQLIDESDHIQRACARFPTLGMFAAAAVGLDRLPWMRDCRHHMTDWDHTTTREVDHVIGAFYLIRRNVFEALEGFDERFFVYLEDLDLSLRVRRAGGRIVFLADAQAFHAGGGTSRQIKATRLFYSLRSRLLYGFKHYSLPSAWALVAVTMVVEPLSRTAFSAARGGMQDIRNTLRGFGMLARSLPQILRASKR